jgi:hypothetical protein
LAAQGEEDRIDDAVLALLLLGLHDGNRAWKGFDWAALNRLYEKGLISKPAGRAKSVIFSDEGLEKAKQLYETLFVNGGILRALMASPPIGCELDLSQPREEGRKVDI